MRAFHAPLEIASLFLMLSSSYKMVSRDYSTFVFVTYFMNFQREKNPAFIPAPMRGIFCSAGQEQKAFNLKEFHAALKPFSPFCKVQLHF